MRTITSLFAACVVAGLCGAHAFAQAAKPRVLELKDLPASVQKTVQETLKAARSGISQMYGRSPS